MCQIWAPSQEQVWETKTLTTAFWNALYFYLSWGSSSHSSDEATGGGGLTNGNNYSLSYEQSLWDDKPSWDSQHQPEGSSTKISVIATFLYRMHKIRTLCQSTGSYDRLSAEARFVRKKVYFEMVKRCRGVPFWSATPQALQTTSVCKTPTKDCFDFIISRTESLCLKVCPILLLVKIRDVQQRSSWGGLLGRVLIRAVRNSNSNKNSEHWQTAMITNKETLIIWHIRDTYFIVIMENCSWKKWIRKWSSLSATKTWHARRLPEYARVHPDHILYE